MKYRTQLYLSILGIILCTTFVSLGFVYWGIHHFLWKELQSKVLTVASTAAVGIDPEELEQIQNGEGDQGPAFQRIVRRLIEIRDAKQGIVSTETWTAVCKGSAFSCTTTPGALAGRLPGPPMTPATPVLRALAWLLEAYGSEYLLAMAMHFRWAEPHISLQRSFLQAEFGRASYLGTAQASRDPAGRASGSTPCSLC